jgi:hypothetical protein
MPNDVLTEEKAARFSLSPLATVGYAAECLMDFQNLGTDPADRLFRLVKVNSGSPFPFRCRVVGHPDAEGDFSFFLPASQVAAYSDEPENEKPKARPFTITEFNERFKLGSHVHFAEKDGGYERHAIYTGYYYIDGPEVRVGLGGFLYKLQDLFDDYKLAIGYVKKDGREDEPLWGIFGVDSGVYNRTLCSDTLSGVEGA